jgi:hypothetical protein
MIVSAESLQLLLAVLFGFGVAGVLATGYQAATRQPLTFSLLEQGPKPAAFASIPVLAFAAPFLIMRITLLSPPDKRRFMTVMTGTITAGIWSLMSGTVVVMALEALR